MRTASSRTTYAEYDALGRVKKNTQTTAGAAAAGYTFTYDYNLAGGLTQVTYPSERVVSYAYDGAGRVAGISGVKDTVPSNYANAMSYAPHGSLIAAQLGNLLWENHCYNPRLQDTVIGVGTTSTQSDQGVVTRTAEAFMRTHQLSPAAAPMAHGESSSYRRVPKIEEKDDATHRQRGDMSPRSGKLSSYGAALAGDF